MFKKHLADSLILFAPQGTVANLLLDQHSALVAQAVHDGPGARGVIISKLGAGAFQKAVVIEELQSPQNLQLAAAHKRNDLAGTQKAVPVDEPDYGSVAVRQLHGGNGGSALKAGKAFICHPATMTGMGEMRETARVAGLASLTAKSKQRKSVCIPRLIGACRMEVSTNTIALFQVRSNAVAI
jgi:hypothetical protein